MWVKFEPNSLIIFQNKKILIKIKTSAAWIGNNGDLDVNT